MAPPLPSSEAGHGELTAEQQRFFSLLDEIPLLALVCAPDGLPAAVETALYRVVQEAVTNSVRHASATRVDVLAERQDGHVVVVVEDDGKGFVPVAAGSTERLGLLGMRERAEALGGTMTIESAPGEGTTIAVEVPCDDPHPDR